MNTEITKEIPVPVQVAQWQSLAPSAHNVFIGVGAVWTFVITLLPSSIFALVADDSPWWHMLAVLGLSLLTTSLAAFIAHRRWLNTSWKLDDEALHVRRGKTWFKQICLPRSRVQHLDFERGPLERRYGLATLVIHTAGSQERTVRQSGLLLADAEYLRDALVPKDRQNDE